MNCAILRSTKHGYLQERDQKVLALDHLGHDNPGLEGLRGATPWAPWTA